MKDALAAITRDDIYRFGVPILTALLAGIPGMIKFSLDRDKYWKCIRYKSAQSNYIKYFWVVYLMGFVVTIVYCFAVAIILSLQIATLAPETIRNSYVIFSALCHLAALLWLWSSFKDGTKISYKKTYKFEKLMAIILYWAPIVMSGLMWVVLVRWSSQKLSFLIVVMCIIVELMAFVVLDDKRTMEYQYATFRLSDETIIANADVDITYQKGNWIIAKYKDDKKEIRFRQKDLKRISYSNTKE